MPISVHFLGGAGTVTGSKFLIETDRSQVLVDCGLFQGLKELRAQNWGPIPFDCKSLDAIILTHAHLDHSGLLPLVVKNGFRGPIFGTAPTRDLAKLILNDHAHIQEEDAKLANEKGFSKHSPAKPLYTVSEANAAFRNFNTVPLERWITVTQDIRFRFKHSGHILGSAFIEMDCEGKRIVFSGDLGRSSPLLYDPPVKLSKADILFIESTYGNRLHDTTPPEKTLMNVVNETVKKRGRLIIPSFAVGRAQEVLYLLSRLKKKKKIPDLPIYLDSPMGIDATESFFLFSEWHKLSRRDLEDLKNSFILVRNPKESFELVRRQKGSFIVIAGSGMVAGGRVLHHLEYALLKPKNTVLLVGFQAAGTRGKQLLDGASEVKIFGKYVPVKAQITELSTLSAHADQGEILEWLRGFSQKPSTTFIVHGEPHASDILRAKIRDELGWECSIPKAFDLVPA